MKLKNLDKILEQLKPKLREYLEEHQTKFTRDKFTCPNNVAHRNEDKSPSAGFFPNTENFNCFVCHSHGDIITAANLIEGYSIEGSDFIDTVVLLANRYGIECDIEEDDTDKKLRKIREMLKLILAATHKTFQTQPSIIEYVKNRHWNPEAYKFGYCNWTNLIKFLEEKGYTQYDIKDGAGLFEQLMDKRLLIPIYDEIGRIVGFTGRSVDLGCEKSQRYLNPMTSLIYKKSDILFNFHNIRAKFDTVYIVEGYADALTLMNNGIENVIALCGTAISDKHIIQLVKHKVKNIILCLDNDEAGILGTQEIAEILRKVGEFQTFVKQIPGDKDPDEFINNHGIKSFLELPNYKLFDFKLEELKRSNIDKIKRENILKMVAEESSHIEKEHMCKKLAKELGVKTETVIQEIEKLEKAKLGDWEPTTNDIVIEREALKREVVAFENWAQTRGELLGLNTLFPLLTEKLDGLQNGLILVAAEENVGKSAFVLSLTLNVVKANPRKVFALYFGLDLNNRTLVARSLANISGLPINACSRPKTHPLMLNNEKNIKRRNDAENYLMSLNDSFSIKDENHIRSIEEMERFIKVYQKAYVGKQLVIIVDSLNKMNTSTKRDTRDLYMYISDRLKKWTTWFDMPVIAISELRKLTHPGARPTNDDIKEVSDLKYDANVTILLYNELHSRRTQTNTFVDQNNLVQPIMEATVFKNNLSDFKGTLYYKFYTNICRVEECTLEEHRKLWSS